MTMRLLHRWTRERAASKTMPDPKAEAGQVSEKPPTCICRLDTSPSPNGCPTYQRLVDPSCPRHGKAVGHV
jgi:hypothetical protein